MPNITLQIRVGKEKANKAGREYKFNVDGKISNKIILDMAENAIADALVERFGEIVIFIKKKKG